MVLDMHSTTQRFQTPLELKKKIHESFVNHVPCNFENMLVYGHFNNDDTEVKLLLAMFSLSPLSDFVGSCGL